MFFQFFFYVSAYLVGSLSTAIMTCQLMNLPDPRTGGSKNPGATNVLRLGGKKAAAITLLGDVLKGTLPVVVARIYSTDTDFLLLVGLFAFLGHLFPLYYGFKGGKGVATFLGVLLGFSIHLFITAILVWLLVALFTRLSSLAALTAAAISLVVSVAYYGLGMGTFWFFLMILLLFIKHSGNIHRLRNGTEPKIGKKSK